MPAYWAGNKRSSARPGKTSRERRKIGGVVMVQFILKIIITEPCQRDKSIFHL